MALRRPAQCNEGVIPPGAVMVDFHLPQRWSAPRRAVRPLRMPLDASAAILAALAAGSVVLLAWLACSITIYDESPWKLPRMMAAMVVGPAALEPQEDLDIALVATGFALHFVLALAFGTLVALVVAGLREGAVAWAGAALGAALYALDLHGMTAFFPWFAPLRTPDTLAAHVLFGIVAATAYRHLAPRSR